MSLTFQPVRPKVRYCMRACLEESDSVKDDGIKRIVVSCRLSVSEEHESTTDSHGSRSQSWLSLPTGTSILEDALCAIQMRAEAVAEDEYLVGCFFTPYITRYSSCC